MPKQRKYEFEDQTVVDLSLMQDEIKIKIECRNEGIGKPSLATVTFNSVRNVHVDNISASAIKPITPDGEIIHFETGDNYALIIVIWHDSAKKTAITKSYKFKYETMQVA